jgi:general secretion pathway protein A
MAINHAAREAILPARLFGRLRPEHIWLGPVQRHALAFFAARTPGSVALLLGPRGCGKSTVLDTALGRLRKSIYFCSRDSWDSPASLLSALLQSAGLTPTDPSDVAQRNLFSAYLHHQRSLGSDITIAVDDAERLSRDVLRELHRLSAVRLGGGYQPQFVMVGRPLTYSRLQSSKASGWSSAHLTVYNMPPPTAADVVAYVQHRLAVADAPPSLFSTDALDLVATFCQSSYTMVNLLCQVALVLATKQGSPNVDERLVREAADGIAARQRRAQQTPRAAAQPRWLEAPRAESDRRLPPPQDGL